MWLASSVRTWRPARRLRVEVAVQNFVFRQARSCITRSIPCASATRPGAASRRLCKSQETLQLVLYFSLAAARSKAAIKRACSSVPSQSSSKALATSSLTPASEICTDKPASMHMRRKVGACAVSLPARARETVGCETPRRFARSPGFIPDFLIQRRMPNKASGDGFFPCFLMHDTIHTCIFEGKPN
jgi:hypothetical protein